MLFGKFSAMSTSCESNTRLSRNAPGCNDATIMTIQIILKNSLCAVLDDNDDDDDEDDDDDDKDHDDF